MAVLREGGTAGPRSFFFMSITSTAGTTSDAVLTLLDMCTFCSSWWFSAGPCFSFLAACSRGVRASVREIVPLVLPLSSWCRMNLLNTCALKEGIAREGLEGRALLLRSRFHCMNSSSSSRERYESWCWLLSGGTVSVSSEVEEG